MCFNQFLAKYATDLVIELSCTYADDISNKIFRNFLSGINFPKILVLFISLSIFGV